MACRHERVAVAAHRTSKTAVAAGVGVLVAMTIVVAAAGMALLLTTVGTQADRTAPFDAYVWRVVRFTLYQATLSTALSVLLAIVLTRALARRPEFAGRTWLLRLFAVPLGLPAIVAALGIIEIWGRQGLLNGLLQDLGVQTPVSIYGLTGILIAHVFFNLPLATRLFLSEVERTPAEYWRNAAALGLSSRRIFLLIEWPAIQRVLPGVAGLVFMLCATSFTLVLLLGGGPRATTIEVAIYQSLRFDFDPPRAVVLALLQIALTACILGLLRIVPRAQKGSGEGGRLRRFDGKGSLARSYDAAILLTASLFVLSPMAATLVAGLSADLAGLIAEPVVRRAGLTSLIIGLLAATLALVMAVSIVLARHALLPLARYRRDAAWLRFALAGASSLILLVPPIVLGAGWFVLLRGRVDVFAAAPFIVVVVNALMALPFVMRVIEPAFATHAHRTDRLCAALGISGLSRLRMIDGPALAAPLATAGAFAAALSLGDLGAIALFGSRETVTLPYLLLQKMGSYRTDDAAGLALILGLACLVLMMLGTRRSAPTTDARIP